MSQTRMPGKCGLYDPQWEHDACGIGAVANISGRRDHSIIEYGNEVLLNLMHRGAAGSVVRAVGWLMQFGSASR